MCPHKSDPRPRRATREARPHVARIASLRTSAPTDRSGGPDLYLKVDGADSSATDEEARKLLQFLGMPFRQS